MLEYIAFESTHSLINTFNELRNIQFNSSHLILFDLETLRALEYNEEKLIARYKRQLVQGSSKNPWRK
jgi:hypothetical protein